MNIILLVIDTLRYDFIAADGNNWVRTPNLDRLAQRSWVFDRAFASSYPTIPHRTDVMTGRLGRPFHPWMPLRFDLPTLPRALAQAGYCTQLIHDTPHLVNGGHNFDWPFHAWTFIHGAEVDRPWIDDAALTCLDNWKQDPLLDFAGDPDCRTITNHTLVTYTRANRKRRRPEDWNAARLFLTAAEWLRDNARRDNFFLWLDCFDPHEPWDAPPEYVLMYDQTPGYDGRIDPRIFLRLPPGPDYDAAAEQIRQRKKALYSGKVSWVDRWFGEVLAALAETGLDKNTAVIVTSDHGTNVGERGRFGKGWPVYEQEAHVPLMVHVPGRGRGRSDITVQPQDVFATVLGIARAASPEQTDGHDALAAAESGSPWPRDAALAGRAAHAWAENPTAPLFTVFDKQEYLVWSPRPEDCRLFRYGGEDAVAEPDAARVEQLWTIGLEETERRGIHPKLAAWLRGRGEGKFPRACCRFPGPKGYTYYWNRLYNRW
ncbi:MAG: hypothetical protein AMJ81_09150 [Phycisphaerae bacterium SM23_33]|nr:MAG: hypothetical protein AMJ81_09150 [Phycisphaerae bacterium SM23_33]